MSKETDIPAISLRKVSKNQGSFPNDESVIIMAKSGRSTSSLTGQAVFAAW